MKILWVEFEGFKGFERKARFDVSQHSLIFGHNGTGKTSIAEGIAYTLYGRTLDGRTKLIDDIVNINCEKNDVTMSVCIQDPVTYEKRIITRVKSLTRGTELLLDDEITTQDSIIGQFGSGDIFLSIFYNPYFMGLEDGEKRKVIESVTDPVDYEEIFSKKADINLIEKYDVKIYDQKSYKKTKKDIDELQKSIESTTTEIEILIKQNSDIEDSTLEEPLEEEEKKLLEKLKSAGEIENRKNVIKSFIENNEKINTQIKDLNRAIQEIGDPGVAEDENEINEKSNAYIQKQNENIQNLLKQMVSPTSWPELIKDTGNCPTCYQSITTDYIEQTNEKIKQIIQTHTENNKKIEDEIQKCRNLIEECSNRRASKIDQIHQHLLLKSRIDDYNSQIKALQSNIYLLKPEDNKVLDFNMYKAIESEYEKVTEYNRQIKLNNSIKEKDTNRKNENMERIDNLNEKLQKLSINMQELKIIADAINPSYLHKKAIEKKMETIKNNLKHVDISLYKQQKNGEWKETFDISFRHKPYRRLSFSEQMLCGLEISYMLNNVSKNNFPIFIDNTESIANIQIEEDNKSQIILSRFQKDQPLSVQEIDLFQPEENLVLA